MPWNSWQASAGCKNRKAKTQKTISEQGTKVSIAGIYAEHNAISHFQMHFILDNRKSTTQSLTKALLQKIVYDKT